MKTKFFIPLGLTVLCLIHLLVAKPLMPEDYSLIKAWAGLEPKHKQIMFTGIYL